MSEKSCPTCGFIGDFDVCPNDQTKMIPQIQTTSSQSDVMEPGITQPPKSAIATIHSNGYQNNLGVGAILDGRYELLDVIGVGGMGTVYKARQNSMNRLVAIKILSPQFSQNPQMIRRFQKEAQVVSKLSHPNTVSVFDYGRSEGLLYLVMEMLDGISLRQRLLDHGPLSPTLAVHIVVQILRALNQAHRSGVVHRDIKPANIFIVKVNGDENFVKVLDFGVAKLREGSSEETVTQAGGIIGTPKYMAPEQARSEEADERCDLYSVGIVLYEMLCGKPPYDGDNPIGIMMDQAQAPIPELKPAFVSQYEYGRLNAIVRRCLKKKPKRRFADADELLAALDNWSIPLESDLDRKPLAPASEKPLELRSNTQKSIRWPAILVLALGGLFFGMSWLDEVQLNKNAQIAESVKDEEVPRSEKNTLQVPRGRQVTISTLPNAVITRLSDGKILGAGTVDVRIEAPAKFRVSADGFVSQIFTINPDSISPRRIELTPLNKITNTKSKSMTKEKMRPESPVVLDVIDVEENKEPQPTKPPQPESRVPLERR